MIFSQRAKKLVGSATMVATLKAQEKIRNGEDIILGSVGEPDGKVPEAAKKELIHQMQTADSKYGPAQGLLSVRESVSRWMSDLYDQKYLAENVIISPGSKFSLFSIMQILCDKTNEVLIPSPYWVSYETLATLAGAQVRTIIGTSEQGYKISAKQLAAQVTDKTKILILNSPQNPSGAVYSMKELSELTQVIEKNPNLVVVCDDIYNQLIFSGEKRSPHILDVLSPAHHERVILVHGASKSFALTGWRLGWVVATKEIISKLTEFQSQTLTCVPDFLQRSLEKTLTEESHFVLRLRERIQKRHEHAVSFLKNCPGIKVYSSGGAFYIWIEVLDKTKKSVQICDELLNEVGVALVPGSAFGCEYHLRFSVTISDEALQKGLKRILAYFSKSQDRSI